MARRMARGFFGGDLFKGHTRLMVDIEIPEFTGVDFDQEQVFKALGNAHAKTIRNRLKAGVGGDGRALPAPKPRRKMEPAGRPLHRTGSLINSIKYRRGLIAPSTTTRVELGKRARSNFGLMAIHISGVYTSKHRPPSPRTIERGAIDPLGSFSDTLNDELQREFNRQFERLSGKGRGRIKLKSTRKKKIQKKV
jgi:hypothetical protein